MREEEREAVGEIRQEVKVLEMNVIRNSPRLRTTKYGLSTRCFEPPSLFPNQPRDFCLQRPVKVRRPISTLIDFIQICKKRKKRSRALQPF